MLQSIAPVLQQLSLLVPMGVVLADSSPVMESMIARTWATKAPNFVG